jgi:hypothetical protein
MAGADSLPCKPHGSAPAPLRVRNWPGVSPQLMDEVEALEISEQSPGYRS